MAGRPRSFGVDTANCCARVFGAGAAVASAACVVAQNRRGVRPCNCSARIKRITRLRPTRSPWACNAACTRGLP
jgi:hypothetical protein